MLLQIARTMTSPPSTLSPISQHRPSFSSLRFSDFTKHAQTPIHFSPYPRHRHASHSFNAPLLNAKHSLNLPTRSHVSISYHVICPSTGSSHTLPRSHLSSSQNNICNYALNLHDPNLISSTTTALPIPMLPAHCQSDSTIHQIREFLLP